MPLTCSCGILQAKHRCVQQLIHESVSKLLNSSSFFFFQAKDGIRDIGVTGVQTCALPILGKEKKLLGVSVVFHDVSWARQLLTELEHTNRQLESAYEELQSTNEELETTNEELQSRSEERRVGKECRTRGARGE